MKETDSLLQKKDMAAKQDQDASSLTSQEEQGRVFEILYWSIVVINVLAALVFLVGQTTEVFNYDWTVSVGLQEPPEEIGFGMVQVNRAFGAVDTIINIPLLLSSAFGLAHRKQVSLICTAAMGGVNLYWSVEVAFIFWFMKSQHVPEWTHTPPVEVWVFVWFFAVYGVFVLSFLYYYWGRLLSFTS